MKQIWLKSAVVVAAVFCGAMSGFAKEWTYNESAKTMTDAEGKWTVKVNSIENLEQGELTVWKAVEPFNDETGTLDLRDITLVKDGASYPITALKLHYQVFEESYKEGVTNFYANHVVGTIPAGMFQGSSFLKEVKISGEGVTGLGKNAFNWCSVLEGVELDCPNMLTIGEMAFYSCVKLAGDIQDVVPSSVTNIGGMAFRMDVLGENTGLTGTLVLTNLSVIGGQAFRKCKGLTGVDLRGPITSFGGNTFNGCSGIRTAVFDTPNLVTVNYDPEGDFYGPRLTNVTFLCAALSQATVIDKILGDMWEVKATTDMDKGCRMYVSRRQEGWADLAQSVDPETREANYIPTSEGNNFMGVYVTADGKRKAWMIHRASPHDSSAFVIRVR